MPPAVSPAQVEAHERDLRELRDWRAEHDAQDELRFGRIDDQLGALRGELGAANAKLDKLLAAPPPAPPSRRWWDNIPDVGAVIRIAALLGLGAGTLSSVAAGGYATYQAVTAQAAPLRIDQAQHAPVPAAPPAE